MKTCSKCGQQKDLILFEKEKRSADGRGSRCKACEKKRHPPSIGVSKPRRIVIAAVKRQNDIVKYGIDVVEAMEGLGNYEERF